MISILSWAAPVIGWMNPRRLLYIAGGITIAFMVWKAAAFIDAKYEAEAEVAALQQQLDARDEAIRILNQSIAQREAAQDAADAARNQIDTRRESIEEIRRNAAAAKEEDNGALAPVLRDALRSLDGLR